MPRLPLGLGVQAIRKVGGGGAAPITTSKAFNSSGVQVGSTNTGDIPTSWVANEATVTSVIFANDNSVTSIGSYAFAYSGLTSVTIPNSVTSIGTYAFRSCTSLSRLTITNSVTSSIGAYTFEACNSLASATIGTGVTSIGNFAFNACTSLASVTFTATSSVTSIGQSAFKDCTSLTSITIPSSVTSIVNYAFQNCDSLSSITIPNSVTTIGEEAFRNCDILATVTIGTGATSIGSYAFYECGNLATVLCYVAQSAFIGSNAFYITKSPLTIRARSTDASWTAGTGLTFQGNTNVTVIKNL